VKVKLYHFQARFALIPLVPDPVRVVGRGFYAPHGRLRTWLPYRVYGGSRGPDGPNIGVRFSEDPSASDGSAIVSVTSRFRRMS